MPNEIVFLTGLAIDKKELNKQYKKIIEDKAAHAFTEDIKDICLSITPSNELAKKTSKEYFTNIISDQIKKIPTIKETIESSLILGTSTNVFSSLIIGSTFDIIFNKFCEITSRDSAQKSAFYESFKKALESDEEVRNKIKDLSSVDFFNVYLSGHSDIRAVPSIAKLVSQKENLRAHWGACDRPFYLNNFINTLKIEIKNEKLLKKGAKNLIFTQYLIHGVDILFSKIIEEYSKSDTYKYDINIGEININYINQFSKEVGKSISERGFFGIDLFSRILITLYNIKNNTENRKTKITNEKDTPPLVIKISSKIDKKTREFLTELIEVSGDPLKVKIENYHKDDEDKTYDILVKDHLENNYGTTYKKNNIKQGSNIYSNFILGNSILIPIKLFLSLPLISNDESLPENVSQKSALPSLVTTESIKHTEVITSGGIEHNRPLMHLINIHRQQKKSSRVFGFLDNYFDFMHRWEKDQTNGYEHLFMMGVAQPVSGYNQVFTIRNDDQSGFSSSLESKQIIFKINCRNTEKELTVFANYGFSARASVFSMLRILTRLVESIKSKEDNFLYTCIDKISYGGKTDINKGYTWKVIFSEKTEEILYKESKDIDPFSVITSPNFPKETEKLSYLLNSNVADNGVIEDIHLARSNTKK